MKKFRDYLLKNGIEEAVVSNVDKPFTEALADGVKALEVTKQEYIALVRYYDYYRRFPWNWSGKTIWGIKLIIKG